MNWCCPCRERTVAVCEISAPSKLGRALIGLQTEPERVWQRAEDDVQELHGFSVQPDQQVLYGCVHMSRISDCMAFYPQYVYFVAITDLTPDLSRDSRPHAVNAKGKSQCRSLFSLHTHTLRTPRDWRDYPHQTYLHVAVGTPSGGCRLVALLALLPFRLLFQMFMQGSIRTPRSFLMRCAVCGVEC